jgi:hypothetical protein
VLALLRGKIPEQLTHPSVARLRDGDLRKIARSSSIISTSTTDHCDRQIGRQPKWFAGNEPFHVLETVLLCPKSPRLAQVFPNQGFKTPDRRVMSIAEGDQLANEQSQDYRLRFAEALPRTAETGLIFRLAPKPSTF